MSNIKKQFVELYELLEANKNKKVSTMMPELISLMTRKGGGSNGKTFMTDEDGNVTHVFCYYHKLWEPIDQCEYGQKKGTASGLNTMCKEGVNQWSKQQRAKKQAEANLLTRLTNGGLTVEQLPAEQQAINDEASAIIPRKDGIGYTEEELS